MEQTSSASYPNILVVEYLKKARRANPEMMMKAQEYLNVGYQKMLTFQNPNGGFGWWAGGADPVVWVSAYGMQQLADMAKIMEVDARVIQRLQAWLAQQQKPEGCWDNAGQTHGEAISSMPDPKIPLTAYVVWSLAHSGYDGPALAKGADYLRKHADKAPNMYAKALVAIALATVNPKDEAVRDMLARLDDSKVEEKEYAYWRIDGQTFSYARGDAASIEATSLIAMAMLKTGRFTTTVNKALAYLVKARGAGGAWGSTQATILALRALNEGMGGRRQEGTVTIQVGVNGQAREIKITEDQADVLQLVDFKDATRKGPNALAIAVEGKSNLMVQAVTRYFIPWSDAGNLEEVKPIDVRVDYDRTKLAKDDVLKAKGTLRYNGKVATYMVIVDLGLPPGFQLDPSAFEKMVEGKKIEKYSATSKQVTLYFGGLKPGDVRTFEYELRAKYPIKAKTPKTTAYEYYTPSNRGDAQPVEIEVTEK